jgi:D-aminopeptidase
MRTVSKTVHKSTARLMQAAAIPILVTLMATDSMAQNERPRARDIGVAPGIFRPGTHNAITDVAGVRVGHTTVWEGDSIRTGVTVILPHAGNLYRERVPGAVYIGNAFGKLIGSTQIQELGELETPIALTCTLCVWQVADAMVDYLLGQPGMENVRSINPVVGETNDGSLSDIRARPIRPEHVIKALQSAESGPVTEGAVGAGTWGCWSNPISAARCRFWERRLASSLAGTFIATSWTPAGPVKPKILVTGRS